MLAVVALALAGCSSGTAVTTPGRTVGATASSATSTVGTPSDVALTITGYAFPAFTAKAGQKITLVDKDAEPHTVTADDGTFDSGSFDSTAPGTLTVPTKPGRYALHCTVHPTMHGTLTVT